MAGNGIYHGFAGRVGQGVFIFSGAIALGAALERGFRDHHIHHYHHHALSDELQGAVDAIVAVPVPVPVPAEVDFVDIEPLLDSQGNPVTDSRGNPIPKDPTQRSKQLQQQLQSGSGSRFAQWRADQDRDKQNRQDRRDDRSRDRDRR